MRVNRMTACVTCHQTICACIDDAWLHSNSPGNSGSDRAGGPSNGYPAREREACPGAAGAGHSARKVSNGAPSLIAATGGDTLAWLTACALVMALGLLGVGR